MMNPNDLVAATELPVQSVKSLTGVRSRQMNLRASEREIEEIDLICSQLGNISRSSYLFALHKLFTLQHPELLCQLTTTKKEK